MRFGERLPSPYGEGETTVWYHPRCAAYRRPEPFLVSLSSGADALDSEALRVVAEFSRSRHRLCRVAGVEQASSGRARCRSCRTLIARGTWRIPLVFHEEGMYNASGFVHLACAQDYFETASEAAALLECIRHFQPDLGDAEASEIAAVLNAAAG